MIQNPARVMRQQLKVLSLAENNQYVPLKDVSIGGIIMVRNLKPGEEELVEPVAGMKEITLLFCLLLTYFFFSVRSQGRRRERT